MKQINFLTVSNKYKSDQGYSFNTGLCISADWSTVIAAFQTESLVGVGGMDKLLSNSSSCCFHKKS